MKIEIIGRDPVITMRITKLIGERAERALARRKRIDAVKHPIRTIRRVIGL